MRPPLIQEGAPEDSPRSSTLLEGSGRCSHVEHSVCEKHKPIEFRVLLKDTSALGTQRFNILVKRSYTWPGTTRNGPPQQWRDSENLQLLCSGSARGEVAAQSINRISIRANASQDNDDDLWTFLLWRISLPYQAGGSRTHSTRRYCSSRWPGSFCRWTVGCWERWRYSSRSPASLCARRHNLERTCTDRWAWIKGDSDQYPVGGGWGGASPSSSVSSVLPWMEFLHWVICRLLLPRLKRTFHGMRWSESLTSRSVRSLMVRSSCKQHARVFIIKWQCNKYKQESCMTS